MIDELNGNYISDEEEEGDNFDLLNDQTNELSNCDHGDDDYYEQLQLSIAIKLSLTTNYVLNFINECIYKIQGGPIYNIDFIIDILMIYYISKDDILSFSLTRQKYFEIFNKNK
jgi:hypothetical protein